MRGRQRRVAGALALFLAGSAAAHVQGPVALTFDDGPDPRLTPQILTILEQAHVPATFFVVGRNAHAYPTLLQRMAQDGDAIGNHSWDHARLTTLSEVAQGRELDATTAAIQAAVPGPVTLFRPPYGLCDPALLRLVQARGLTVVRWSADDHDYRGWPAARLQSEVMAETQAGGIVLMHDIHANTVAALPGEIAALKAQGAQFVTVPTLMTWSGPVLPARYPLDHPPEWQAPPISTSAP
jgi:peptidoglycan-N-acetylglucosamine deacetylase